MFSLANNVVSGLLSSEGSTVFNSLDKEGDLFNSSSQFGLGVSEETLGIDDGLFTLDLSGGVSVSLGSRRGDFSITSNNISVMLGVSSILFTLFLSNELINKSNNIINNTFGSEVNL
jgi:hypothetical protein